jgi:hypothetical protein
MLEKTAIMFFRGSLPKHFDVRFTPYFEKNIKELPGPIPQLSLKRNGKKM